LKQKGFFRKNGFFKGNLDLVNERDKDFYNCTGGNNWLPWSLDSGEHKGDLK
jgi:hypothetical protein